MESHLAPACWVGEAPKLMIGLSDHEIAVLGAHRGVREIKGERISDDCTIVEIKNSQEFDVLGAFRHGKLTNELVDDEPRQPNAHLANFYGRPISQLSQAALEKMYCEVQRSS